MIPKIIHFCWFGHAPYTPLIEKCLKTWEKYLSDYKIILWNEQNFDLNTNNWVKQAYAEKKYAFVSDYVRLFALYKFGGIYLDTDVKVLKSFNDLLNENAFMCFEDMKGEVVASCVIGAIPRHPFIAECMEYYNRNFDVRQIIEGNEANVIEITRLLKGHGLKIGGKEQIVADVHIYPRTYFCPMDFFSNWDKTSKTYCIHLFSGSWLPDDKKRKLDRRKKWWWKIAKRIYSFIKDFIQ